jgi:hypothetical protein
MKKKLLSLVFIGLLFAYTTTQAQNYNGIVNYALNATPVNGVKIKTNLPFTSSSNMPTIILQGFNYGSQSAIGLQIVYYIFGAQPAFINASVSSFGNYTPPITLANEDGKVVIFINDKSYFSRFTVSAYSKGMPQDVAINFQGWTAVDEALTGTDQLLLLYKNSFAGVVNLPGTGIWNASGNVGIGTLTPPTGYKLAVNGSVIATSVTVKVKTAWPDYVFKKEYKLPTLTEVKNYIDQNHHLPEMPSEKEIADNGLNLGEMNKILTKKVEELTLYLIEKDQQLKKQQKKIDILEEKVEQVLKAVSIQSVGK